jgi:RNA polymerase-binding protein DksA
MDKHDTDFFSKLLLKLRAEVGEQLKGAKRTLSSNVRESAGEQSTISFHLADMGTDTMEHEKTFWFASIDSMLLKEIDNALEKIRNNVFGLCDICNKEINRKRLEVIPHARLCIDCKSNEENLNN